MLFASGPPDATPLSFRSLFQVFRIASPRTHPKNFFRITAACRGSQRGQQTRDGSHINYAGVLNSPNADPRSALVVQWPLSCDGDQLGWWIQPAEKPCDHSLARGCRV